MITYLIGRNEVHAYLRDLLERLAVVETVPTVWLAVTESGKELVKALVPALREMMKTSPALCEKLLAARIVEVLVTQGADGPKRFAYREKNADGTMSAVQIGEAVRGCGVLLLDGSIHTGGTMRDCARDVLPHGPKALYSYALVVKRNSAYIPTFWGLMTAEYDRPYFLLESIPNQRLCAGKRAGGFPQLPVSIELLDQDGCRMPPICCATQSLDRFTWEDRYYDQATSGGTTFTYVLKQGTASLGYLTLHQDSSRGILTIEEIAVHHAHQGQGHSGVLLRFAETFARNWDDGLIHLYARGTVKDLYGKNGYKEVKGQNPVRVDAEDYFKMEKKVIYHPLPE